MKCPRCGSQLEAFDAPLPDGSSIATHRCAASDHECGVWYDGRNVAALHARLSEPGVRDALVNAARVAREPSRPHPRCPRCEASGAPRDLSQIEFLGLTLDLCDACLGLWIDREEIPALLNALPLYEAGEGAVRITHYRSAAFGSEMHENDVLRTHCVSCKQLIALDQTLATEFGFMCVLCADAREHGEVAPAPNTGEASALRHGRSALWAHVRGALRAFGLG